MNSPIVAGEAGVLRPPTLIGEDRHTLLRWAAYRFYLLILLAAIAPFSACKKPKPVARQSMEELLDDLANDKDDNIRIATVHQLGVTKDPAALGVLIVALHDRSDRVRIAAASALGDSKDPKVADALANAARDLAQDRTVRFAAARALVSLHDARAAAPLIQSLPYSRFEASKSLTELGPLAVPALIDALREPITGDDASELLISMGNAGVDPLIKALHGDIRYDKMAAARTLAEIDDPSAKEALSQALKSGDLELSASAYRFLLRQGETGTEILLIKVLNGYGKLGMAEDFVVSGNAVLKAAAEDWARRNNRPLQGRTSNLDVVYWAGVDPSVKPLGLFPLMVP